MERTRNSCLRRIISGGQTGVDRGALDAAIALGIAHGGWCPRGRLAEDGRIADRYDLQETRSPEYPARTERNVVDADGTLILYRGEMQGGTELTRRLAKKHGKPLLSLDLDEQPGLAAATGWLEEHQIQVLNVAGPRESSAAGIARQAYDFLMRLLTEQHSSDQATGP